MNVLAPHEALREPSAAAEQARDGAGHDVATARGAEPRVAGRHLPHGAVGDHPVRAADGRVVARGGVRGRVEHVVVAQLVGLDEVGELTLVGREGETSAQRVEASLAHLREHRRAEGVEDEGHVVAERVDRLGEQPFGALGRADARSEQDGVGTAEVVLEHRPRAVTGDGAGVVIGQVDRAAFGHGDGDVRRDGRCDGERQTPGSDAQCRLPGQHRRARRRSIAADDEALAAAVLRAGRLGQRPAAQQIGRHRRRRRGVTAACDIGDLGALDAHAGVSFSPAFDALSSDSRFSSRCAEPCASMSSAAPG